MTAYYNEFDPNAAAWLRELIKAGLIADGVVDERSIKDVQADDVKEFTQCHFFAGIGGWSYALRLAGIGDDVAVWTGSCPCQPYSSAGKQKGNDDARNLWPEFFRLIAECSPDVVFGEQVEGAIRHGWLDGISADLEREGYAVGHCVLGAHSVGAPHIRQRLYWVADAGSLSGVASNGRAIQRGRSNDAEQARVGSGVGGLSDARRTLRCAKHGSDEREWTPGPSLDGTLIDEPGVRHFGLGIADGERQSSVGRIRRRPIADTSGSPGCMGDADSTRSQERIGDGRIQPGPFGTSPWEAFELASCRDGKARRVAPGVPLLAHGIPGRVAQLRGLGNAIVPQVAAEFIQAYLEARQIA